MQVNDLDEGLDWKKLKIPILKQGECSFNVSLEMKIFCQAFLRAACSLFISHSVIFSTTGEKKPIDLLDQTSCQIRKRVFTQILIFLFN